MKAHATSRLIESELTHAIIGSFYRVHRELGFGFRENIYSLALERELAERGHSVRREVAVMVFYRGRPLAQQRLDMVVDGRVLVEVKTSETLPQQATAQLFGYLCATNLEVGLLLHFGHEPRFYRVIYENRLKRRGSEGRRPAATGPADGCAPRPTPRRPPHESRRP